MGENEQTPGQLELPCGEPGCDQKVVYRRQQLPGVAYDRVLPEVRTAYLECPDGHLRRYRIGA